MSGSPVTISEALFLRTGNQWAEEHLSWSTHVGWKKKFPAQPGEEKEEFTDVRDAVSTVEPLPDNRGEPTPASGPVCFYSPGRGEVSGYTR